MNKFFLWIVMLPSGLWRSMGVDAVQLKAILTARLTMDDRKPLSFGRQRKKKNIRFGSITSMLFSALFGFMGVIILEPFKETMLGLAAYFTYILFLLSFTLVTDFSNVLIDTRDKYVLLPRPVNDKTLVFSKLLYIFIYLLRIVVPMSLAGWVYIGATLGWKSAIWFPIPMLSLMFIALFLVNGLYLLLLRIAGAEKFKEIISYFQIVFSVFVFLMAYIVPNALRSPMLQHINYEDIKWVRFVPSYWMAATWHWLGVSPVFGHTRWFAAFAIIFPIACFWITIKYLSPSFARNVGGMDVSESAPPQVAGKKVKKGGYYQTLSNLVNKSDAAKAGFNMVWLQTSRNRAFRMKLYPMFAFVPIYFVYILLQGDNTFMHNWHSLPYHPSRMLVILYACAMVMMQAIGFVTLSDQYKAAWVYYSAPVDKPGNIMAGGFKALWIKFLLPFFIIVSGFVLWVWGIKALPDTVLALANITLFGVITSRIAFRYFPFSQLEQMKNTGLKTFLRTFLTMLIVGVLAGLHVLTIHFDMLYLLKYVFLLLVSILLWLVWDSYRNTSWAAMKTVDEQA